MAACLLATQHSFVVAQMEIWSTHTTCFPGCSPVPDVLSKDELLKKPASGSQSGEKSEAVIWGIREKTLLFYHPDGVNNKPVNTLPLLWRDASPQNSCSSPSWAPPADTGTGHDRSHSPGIANIHILHFTFSDYEALLCRLIYLDLHGLWENKRQACVWCTLAHSGGLSAHVCTTRDLSVVVAAQLLGWIMKVWRH